MNGGTKFLILAPPRSGSNMLCSLLNSHPEIVCHHELFNSKGIRYALDWRDANRGADVTLEERDIRPLTFLQKTFDLTPNSVVGFKMTSYPNQAVLHAQLTNNDVKKIILRRINHLRMYVSYLIASETKQWEVYKKDAFKKKKISVFVNKDEFIAHVEGYEDYLKHCEEKILANGGNFITVNYEDLKKVEVHKGLLEYLEVKDVNHLLSVLSVKQNDSSLSELISNFDEIVSDLTDTPYKEELNR